MAQGALFGVVPGRGVGGVAGGTFGDAAMVELEGGPVGEGVAVAAFAGEMIGRLVGFVAAQAVGGGAFVAPFLVAGGATGLFVGVGEGEEAVVYLAEEGDGGGVDGGGGAAAVLQGAGNGGDGVDVLGDHEGADFVAQRGVTGVIGGQQAAFGNVGQQGIGFQQQFVEAAIEAVLRPGRGGSDGGHGPVQGGV